MKTFVITFVAAPYAGGEAGETEYDAATSESAVAAFWEDVNRFSLAVSRVLAVSEK